MSSNNPTIGVLLLVTIVISVSVAFVALKVVAFYNSTVTYYRQQHSSRQRRGTNPRQVRRKYRHSGPSSAKAHSNTWVDLEKCDIEYHRSAFIGSYIGADEASSNKSFNRSDLSEKPQQVWYPTHISQVTWNSLKPQQQNLNHYGSSNMEIPSAVAQFPGNTRVLEQSTDL